MPKNVTKLHVWSSSRLFLVCVSVYTRCACVIVLCPDRHANTFLCMHMYDTTTWLCVFCALHSSEQHTCQCLQSSGQSGSSEVWAEQRASCPSWSWQMEPVEIQGYYGVREGGRGGVAMSLARGRNRCKGKSEEMMWLKRRQNDWNEGELVLDWEREQKK